MKISLFLLTLLLSVNYSYAGSLLDTVKNDDFLIQGNTSILEHGDDHYLVSVGVADTSTSSSRLEKIARITSKVKAQHQLSQFINEVKVITTEQLEEKTVAEQHGRKKSTREIETKYIEIIKEMNEGPLKNIINIGSWSDSVTYFYAIGIKIPE